MFVLLCSFAKKKTTVFFPLPVTSLSTILWPRAVMYPKGESRPCDQESTNGSPCLVDWKCTLMYRFARSSKNCNFLCVAKIDFSNFLQFLEKLQKMEKLQFLLGTLLPPLTLVFINFGKNWFFQFFAIFGEIAEIAAFAGHPSISFTTWLNNYYRIYSTISRAIFTQIKTEVN